MTHAETPAHRHLVLRVNELFHDLEGKEYENVHPEIFKEEVMRWNTTLSTHFTHTDGPMTIVDVGAGTGFVGDRLLPHLQKGDSLICADISATMLDVVVPRLQSARPDVDIRSLKMTDERIELPDASVDIITMNSVLHHIPDWELALRECLRVLRIGGLMFIGHEPNRKFFRSALSSQAAVLHRLAPKRIAASILRALGLYNRAVRQKEDPLLRDINAKLLAEGLIEHPLSRAELSPLIDVHSPTAGYVRPDEGFDPAHLFDNLACTTIALQTYNHLGKMSGKYTVFKPYEWLLQHLRPQHGATFFVVARKDA